MVQASTFEGPLDFDKENGDFLQWGGEGCRRDVRLGKTLAGEVAGASEGGEGKCFPGVIPAHLCLSWRCVRVSSAEE